MKMFKNCPYEKYGRTSCEGCPLFWRCLVKKLRRKLKTNGRVLWVAIIIFLLILVVGLNIREANREERNRWLRERDDVCITNDEMATQKFRVATVSSKSEIVLKPTSTPKATKKPETKKQLE